MELANNRVYNKIKSNTELLNQIDSSVKTMVMNGIRPIWNASAKYCTVNGDIISFSYSVHRALLQLNNFAKQRKQVEEVDCDEMDFTCLM